MESYGKLRERVKTAIQLQSVTGIIQWDMYTKIPPRGLEQRAEQLAVMSQIQHQMMTDPEIGKILSNIDKDSEMLDQFQQREVELVKRNWKIQSALPEKLVTDEAKQKTISTSQWRKAKTARDWKIFQPELEKLLVISRERAEHLIEPTGTKAPYDALLDLHEPGISSAIVTKVFTELRKGLVPLVKKYENKCQEVNLNINNFRVLIEDQRRLISDLVNYVGFDTTSDNAGGRIDESEHPFTSSYFDDTRMTVHYQEDDVFQAIFGGLHEAGHSIQGQSKNPEWKWMFLGDKSSAGINESQARFVENIIGRSPEFWKYYYERFLGLTSGVFNDVSREDFVRTANVVKPSKIRITADEMTYALHIIIRYEIEIMLFSGELEVAEIPQVWNDKYEKYLGVKIENDSEGALQDTHWAWAYWGYFPTYSLGNIYSGMILETLEKNVPEWRSSLSNGSVEVIINWLRENVHFKANLYNPDRMLEEITGRKIMAKPFIEYLQKKYVTIFG
ncbi:carboxypeptidase M32 [Candidatus Thorarchaeota archaeon]|nr:MAG: carboxypeptidase M32 [Candidatus Thorarchaeota archaeon]